MFSNHDDALPFDNTDRRVNVTANPQERKDGAYYARLYGLVGDNAFIGSVRRLLETMDISNFRAGEHAPMNAAKEQMLNTMMTEVERAVFDFKEECKTDLISREKIKAYVDDAVYGSASWQYGKGVNDGHLTHAIRRWHDKYRSPDPVQAQRVFWAVVH
jgi:hypothetical protein